MPFSDPLEEIRHADLVFPNQANHQGTYFGGVALAVMDKVAFLVAARHARRPFVTASCDRIDFRAPAYVGELVEVTGHVRMVGRHSLSVMIELAAESLLTGERRICTRGGFTMVAADRKDNPAPLPPAPEPPERRTEPPKSSCRSLRLVFPGDTNHLGQLFGGEAMSLMGKAAYIAASRHARCSVGMAASERHDFEASVLEGELLDVSAEVVSVGRTSMRVQLIADAENLMTGERRRCGRAEYIMVALDENGKPTPAPAL